MRSSLDVDGIFKEILNSTAEKLKPLGFARRGQTFRLLSYGNCGLIEFQRSISNTSQVLKFTVNLGVVCGELLSGKSPAVKDAHIIDAHLRERIGFLSQHRSDKWWEVTESTDPDPLVQEVVGLVVDRGVPYVQSYIETRALIALWESGEGPGLTEFQRTQFLSKLKAARVSHP